MVNFHVVMDMEQDIYLESFFFLLKIYLVYKSDRFPQNRGNQCGSAPVSGRKQN